MVPTPQDSASQNGIPISGERIVISGMSGLYPNSHHVQDLADILYNKINPVSTDNSRWNYNHPELAQHTGKVPGLDLFDGQFFKVHYRLGNNMDPMGRKVLEHVYQAIYDAGVSPVHLNGKKVGVYIGTCFSEAEKACFYVATSRTGFGIAGCSKAMFANRISYWLNAKGPSFSIDDACCSSSVALEQAYLDISRGECEAAIVGGSNLCLHPQSSVHYGRIMKLSTDGKTKSFDQHADGCTRSEAISVLFLQKAKDALRIYAEVLNVENKFIGIMDDAVGPRYGPYRDSAKMVNFIEKFYEKSGVSPSVVEYVEAFGSAVSEADKAELDALDAVFCKNRKDPLMVGSVMSNIGYCEAASGITAITKVLLGYHKGEMAANINCETPREDVIGLREGRMRIVTENQKFRRTYAAVNAISVTGTNCHVLLHGHHKHKDLNRYKSNIPHLVTISGRQNFSVKKIFKELKSNPIDPEQLALLHNIHSTSISGHLGRGFIILDTNADKQTVCLREKADYFDDVKRPLCFVYSGMGSQWPGMGAQLMRIPIFAAAIERCHKILQPKGIDIVHIITTPDKNIFDNILHSFVGIAAIQIGLTDIMQAVGLVPDIIIGHSVGELGCAYGDGCFTAEEMILAAYYRGLVSVQTPFIRGSMAAIGIGYQKIKDLCPPEIEVACHNGPDSCTISGPAEVMKLFVEQLTAENIFAKEVPCSNIAYHSRYIAEAGPGLIKYLSETIRAPKARSKRWLSTSVPKDKWDEPAARYSSAQYHTNNLLNPVLFEETSRLLPANAVLVEIAPHGLLQAILKRSLPSSCQNIPLTRRDHTDNACFVLEALGQLYMEGYLPKIDVLYPKVEFPVSTGTPFLSNFVEWVHSDKWLLPLYLSANRTKAAVCNFIVSIHDDEHSYLKGNVIRDKIYYPYAAALVAAWDTLAMFSGYPKKQLSVQFSDIHLYSQPILHNRRQLRIGVSLHRGTGRFEIMDDESKVATGFIVSKTPFLKMNLVSEQTDTQDIILQSDDVYKLLRERGYAYDGAFKSIQNVNEPMTKAHIQWDNNWVILIDGLLQLLTLRNHYGGVSEANIIRNMGIDVKKHSQRNFTKINGKIMMEADIVPAHDYISCGGVTLESVLFHNIPMKENDVITKSLQFIPRYTTNNLDVSSTLHVYLQMVAENTNRNLIKILEVLYNDKEPVLNEVKAIINNLAVAKFQYKQAELKSILREYDHILSDTDVVLVKNLSTDENLTEILYKALDRNTFLINLEECHIIQRQRTKFYDVLSSHNSGNFRLSLIRWKPEDSTTGITEILVRTHSDLATLSTARESLISSKKLVILTSYPPIPGLKELVTCWRQDSKRNQVYLVMISNDGVSQTLNQIPELNLAFNILNKGTWGGDYYIPWNENLNVRKAALLNSKLHGDIGTVSWAESHKSDEPGIPVTVHYAGLNILDAKRATGAARNHDDNSDSYGMDFSGITNSGQRVMGLVKGAASTRVLALPEFLWPVPEHWSLEDAATVPLAYVQAFYCLVIKWKLYPGQSILVHGGAGALGQAFISIALHYECDVFTTVCDTEKKRFLLKLFPDLKEDQIGNSRYHSFGDLVMSITKGKGCDIVISCVNEDLKNTTFRCSSNMGVMFDFTQLTNRDNYVFGMKYLTQDRSYCLIDISSIFSEANSKVRNSPDVTNALQRPWSQVDQENYCKTLGHCEQFLCESERIFNHRIQTLLGEGIALGTVRPLSRIIFGPQDAARALRLLANSRHRGKVLLQLQDYDLPAQPSINCSPEQWHIVFCQDDFGLLWVERLVNRGARRLQLHFSEVSNYALYKIQLWRQKGVEVKITCEDLSHAKTILPFFHDCTKTAPAEGIYLIATIRKDKTEQKLVAYLDLLSRQFCQTLKYFAVVSTDNAIGQHACLGRAQEQLPATLLVLPTSTNKQDLATVYWRSAVAIMERALCSSHTIVLAHHQEVVEHSLLTQIANISEIKIPQETDYTTNLQTLGITDEKIPILLNFLRDTYGICYNEQQIKSLSLERIKYLEETTTKTDFKGCNVKGLKTFYAYVDTDELLATTDMVSLPTLTNDASMRDDEFDVTQKYLCIIPGLEGHYKRFSLLCERLKMNALVLQPGLDNLHEDIPQLAERYAKILLKKVGLSSMFYLMGYECGITVTLEVAKILEEHGLTGTIYCIGASPEELKAIVENEVSKYNTEELQDAVAQHMFLLMGGDRTVGMNIDLKIYSTWKEKKDACVRILLGHVAYSTQYARAHIDSAFSRIAHIRNFNPKPNPLRSKIIMLQASGIQTSETSSMRSRNCMAFPNITYIEMFLIVLRKIRFLNYQNRYIRCKVINKFASGDFIESASGSGAAMTSLDTLALAPLFARC